MPTAAHYTRRSRVAQTNRVHRVSPAPSALSRPSRKPQVGEMTVQVRAALGSLDHSPGRSDPRRYAITYGVGGTRGFKIKSRWSLAGSRRTVSVGDASSRHVELPSP